MALSHQEGSWALGPVEVKIENYTDKPVDENGETHNSFHPGLGEVLETQENEKEDKE